MNLEKTQKHCELTIDDCDLILDCLNHTRSNYEDYRHYPSYEFKQEQLNLLTAVEQKLKCIRDGNNVEP